jgi:ABC-type antimicrobial peptide transport system permease subunit
VVSESFSRRFYPGGDPIGKQFLPWFLGYSAEEALTIVGVVGDIRSRDLTDEPGPEIYLPQAQAGINRLAVLVRTPAGVDVLPSIRAEVQALDPNLPLREVAMLEGTIDRAMGTPRFYLTLLTIFAGIALALAVIGLYGVVSFVVSRRTREIGVRMAMGADSGAVTRMILWQGLRPTVLGVALGVGGSYVTARFLGALLYNVEPHDLTTLASVTGILLVVVIAAILIPARRASKLSPITALRVD